MSMVVESLDEEPQKIDHLGKRDSTSRPEIGLQEAMKQ
jgi:hypothetical protein